MVPEEDDAVPIKSVDDLVAALERHHLLTPEQQAILANELRPAFPDLEACTTELVRRGWLTAYTADMLLDRLKPPTHTDLIDRLADGSYSETIKDTPPLRGGSIARQLGVFVGVSMLVALSLYLLFALPPIWALFWGFVLYRIAWNPFDLIDRSCAGCGCAFFCFTAATAFILNWVLEQNILQAMAWGAIPGLIVVLVCYAPLAYRSVREDNQLRKRLLAVPTLTVAEAKKQAEAIIAHARMCRYTEAPLAGDEQLAQLAPLLKEFFTRFERIKFFFAEGHTSDDLRFSRVAVQPSKFLAGYVQLNYYEWISCETAVKPHEETIYVIDGRKHVSGFVVRERQVPEITEQFPSIYHFILNRLVFSGHALADQERGRS